MNSSKNIKIIVDLHQYQSSIGWLDVCLIDYVYSCLPQGLKLSPEAPPLAGHRISLSVFKKELKTELFRRILNDKR